MTDFIYRGVLRSQHARFVYAHTTETVSTAVLAHGCDPVAAHVLSRALTVGVLVSPLLEGDERLTLRWHYEGEVKSVVVDVDCDARVRGFIVPTDLGSRVVDEDSVYGDAGRVAVIKSSHSATLNAGNADAALLDVVEDMAYHFSVSDQVESGMTVLVGFCTEVERPVTVCQGLLLQALPGADLAEFDRLRRRLAAEETRALLARTPRIDNYFERVLNSLLPEGCARDYSVTEGAVPQFHCRCSRDRMLEVVRAMPQADLDNAARKQEALRVACRFCARNYVIAAADVSALSASKRAAG